MIGIRGIGSSIAKSFCNIVYDDVVEIDRDSIFVRYKVDKYLICQGILYGKRRIDMSAFEVSNTYKVNFTQIACMCDHVFDYNENARICLIGSESGIVGSYDEVYADSKRLLHHYVETKRIGPRQQLVCVAPSIIEDSAMTAARADVDNLSKIRDNHPKNRFLRSIEVAKMAKYLLYGDLGYTTNVVIRMNGGSHIR